MSAAGSGGSAYVLLTERQLQPRNCVLHVQRGCQLGLRPFSLAGLGLLWLRFTGLRAKGYGLLVTGYCSPIECAIIRHMADGQLNFMAARNEHHLIVWRK